MRTYNEWCGINTINLPVDKRSLKLLSRNATATWSIVQSIPHLSPRRPFSMICQRSKSRIMNFWQLFSPRGSPRTKFNDFFNPSQSREFQMENPSKRQTTDNFTENHHLFTWNRIQHSKWTIFTTTSNTTTSFVQVTNKLDGVSRSSVNVPSVRTQLDRTEERVRKRVHVSALLSVFIQIYIHQVRDELLHRAYS